MTELLPTARRLLLLMTTMTTTTGLLHMYTIDSGGKSKEGKDSAPE
jgi:hypothetical protein